MTHPSGYGAIRSVLTRFHHQRARAVGNIVGVSACLLLFLGLGIASCSPDLHGMICPDAGKANDYCAVKQFQCGSVEAPVAQVMGPSLHFVLVVGCCPSEELHRASPLFRLSPARAPPFEFLLR